MTTDSGGAREKIHCVSQWLKRLSGGRQATMAGFLAVQPVREFTSCACCAGVVALKCRALVRPLRFVCNPLSIQNKRRQKMTCEVAKMSGEVVAV